MEYLHPAGEMVGGRHSSRAEPRGDRRSPANRVFDGAKPVKQQNEDEMVAQGRILEFEPVPYRELPSDPASRRGRLVYRRPVLPFAAGWPECPQNPGGLAIWPPGGCALGSRPIQSQPVRTPGVSSWVRRNPLKLSESRVDGRRG